ncbi:MAG: FAD-binding protein, partial [Halobacteriales archaeon]
MTWSNWSGSVDCDAEVVRPRNRDDVVDVLSTASTARPAGSGHSFSPLVASDDIVLDFSRMDDVAVYEDEAVAVVQPGVTLGEMNEAAGRVGLTMENMGDVDRQTVVGAVSTGTHGTGEFGALANYVSGVEVVTPDGDVEWIDRDDPRLEFAAISLGALGVVTSLEFELVDDYGLRMERRREPLEDAVSNFRQRVRDSRNHEFFWFPHTETAITKTSVEADVSGGSRGDAGIANKAFELLCRSVD